MTCTSRPAGWRRVGEAAALQGRFWEDHDDLFAAPVGGHERAAVLSRLENLGLDRARLERDLASGVPAERVRSGVALCSELGLTATSSLVLGGHALRGGLPPWLMDELMGGLLGPRD